jgi:signal peptidase I
MSIATTIRNAALFLDLSEDLLDEGYGVRFRADGTSMQPTIEDGDAITVASVALTDIKRGDILVYRCGRRIIAHRVVHIRTTGNEIAAFVLQGDAKTACDAPVAPNQILGRVVAIERRGGCAVARTWCAKLIQEIRQLPLANL